MLSRYVQLPVLRPSNPCTAETGSSRLPGRVVVECTCIFDATLASPQPALKRSFAAVFYLTLSSGGVGSHHGNPCWDWFDVDEMSMNITSSSPRSKRR